ncbi:MAG: hypothetical protein DWQ37_12055 [Planctomycetota bacterium]|nr:MAG: hypothetical protein DWQ37_12055 [Planctomycetota bacterium]
MSGFALSRVCPAVLASVFALSLSNVALADQPQESPTAQDGPSRAEVLHQARRLLVDLPGQDPLAALTTDALLQAPVTESDTAAGPTLPTGDLDATSATPDLSPQMMALCDKVRRVLAAYYPKHQSARDNSPWEVMHAIIGYGVDTMIYQEGPGSEKINAIGYMCYNYPCRGQRMLFLNRGKIDAEKGVGVQGHGGQFLAILAQSHVQRDYPMRVQGKSFTIEDLIEREKESCLSGEELTFKLIALAHYLDSDATWISSTGQQWSIQRLIREELAQPVRGAACGGTHRLMGFSYALNRRDKQGKPIEGEFARARKFINDYHRYTFSLQNPDGSFSTAWFERRADEPSIDRRIKTSGHILEWITFSLPEEQLTDPRMVKAVDYLATIMLNNTSHTWEIGPLGHAVHAMALYDARVFKGVVPPANQPLADEHTTGSDREARR